MIASTFAWYAKRAKSLRLFINFLLKLCLSLRCLNKILKKLQRQQDFVLE